MSETKKISVMYQCEYKNGTICREIVFDVSENTMIRDIRIWIINRISQGSDNYMFIRINGADWSVPYGSIVLDIKGDLFFQDICDEKCL